MDGHRMAIGEFAVAAGLTPKALRLYDELGLLRPAEVDPATGYRTYARVLGSGAPPEETVAEVLAAVRAGGAGQRGVRGARSGRALNDERPARHHRR